MSLTLLLLLLTVVQHQTFVYGQGIDFSGKPTKNESVLKGQSYLLFFMILVGSYVHIFWYFRTVFKFHNCRSGNKRKKVRSWNFLFYLMVEILVTFFFSKSRLCFLSFFLGQNIVFFLFFIVGCFFSFYLESNFFLGRKLFSFFLLKIFLL